MRQQLTQWLLGCVTLPMAHTPRIEGRLEAILEETRKRAVPGRRTLMAATVIVIGLAASLAALRPEARAALASPGNAVDCPQLRSDFTLRYAATITDRETPQRQYQEYRQMRDDYQRLLRQNPHYQPVPEEALRPFAFYQSRRPKVRRVRVTLSARHGLLLLRTEEKADTFTYVYDGKGTHLFWNGHSGRTDPGLEFGPEFSMPAVSLPRVPLLQTMTLPASAGPQAGSGQCLILGANDGRLYMPSTVQAVRVGGVWKILGAANSAQQMQFFGHQQFQGVWIASRMRLTRYDDEAGKPVPTSSCDYRLLAAGERPLGAKEFGLATPAEGAH